MTNEEIETDFFNGIQENITGRLIAGMDLQLAVKQARDETMASPQLFERATKKYNQLFFYVQGRNDYYGIDEYSNIECDQHSNCTRMVESFKTKKQALAVCHHMNRLAQHINQLNIKLIKRG